MSDPISPTFEGDYLLTRQGPFELDSGATLNQIQLHYAIYGKLNDRRSNAVLVCHALSGSARVADWWEPFFQGNAVFDLTRHCVIGINVIGSCYGSTGPREIDPETGKPFGSRFPLLSIRDWVKAQAILIEQLGVRRLHAVLGGSIGGMQAIQWSIDYPDQVARCIAIGAAPLTAMGLALNHLQRKAIKNDANWKGGDYYDGDPPSAGLALARAIAMCSYKSAELFDERYARNPNRNGEDPERSLDDRYDIGGYLDYQGEIFTRRFDANSYLLITKAMDNFDPASGYESEAAALARIRARVLMVGISSDWLFPAAEVRSLTNRMRDAGAASEYVELDSNHGHDGFLADLDRLAPIIRNALE
ncbi:MAG: homoserine O-acetyltransferase [Acidobacteriota bacterium]|nr:MAG: homoserine O-acetyltransferase [Acidobacteriota bacterium]